MRNRLGISAGIILGLIFLAAGLGKSLSQTETFVIFVFPEFLPTALDKIIFRWLPRLEIAIGTLLIFNVAAKLVTSLALALTVSLIANNSILLIQGLGDKPCGCFGAAEPMAQYQLSIAGALYVDIMMLALGLVVLFCYQSDFLNIKPWFLRRS